MNSGILGSKPVQNVVVCHSNRLLANLGKIQGERYGVRVHLAKNGRDTLTKAKQHHADLIVLGGDLKNPSTDETIKLLEADPKVVAKIVTIRGPLPNLSDLLGRRAGI
jgi:CheY-like chemotaxis protein